MNKRVRILLLALILLLSAVLLSGCSISQGEVNLNAPPAEAGWWQFIVVYPLTKALIWLNKVIASIGIPYSYGYAIIVFTVIVKLVTLPLTLKQLQSSKATQELQPKLKALQEKYGKDRQKLAEEQTKLYKEAGVNPLGGCLPLLVQLPVLWGLYQALYVLANPSVGELQDQGFYWIKDLSFPDLTTGMSWIARSFTGRDYGMLAMYISLPLIMIITQLLLQKMTQLPKGAKGSQDAQGQMMGQMMMVMPVMFGYITLGLPSGLTLYWTVSNILSIVQQYFVTGWGGLGDWIPALKSKTVTLVGQTEAPPPTTTPALPEKPTKRRRRRK